ncbi:sensor histidine kinase [Paludibacterium yongneupense]|uniref:sensor histidine kinase n=1 Tax=Paludibacterium yongneupense TaxID=400061 RepID=UPI000403B883|nr:ATP-binding protein [Paludibacterium yongneupense]
MKSIKAKLTVWLIVGVTFIVGLTGLFSFNNSKAQEEADYLALRNALSERLSLSLPNGVWQLDDQYIRLTLDAELGWSSINAIRIRGDAGLNTGRIRDEHGLRDMTPSEEPPSDDILTLPIVYQGREKLGKVTVYLSRQELESKLRRRLFEIIGLIVALDSLLLILLSQALRRFVFKPLAKLQQALDWAASSKDVSTADFVTEYDNEFGSVLKSFNRILGRITADLAMRTAAETSARLEQEKAEEAYSRLLLTQKSLVESEKFASLGGLVAGVAHEINTPVGVTLTTASHLAAETQHLSRDLEMGSIKKSDFQSYLQTARECCELILSNSERAANLIHSFKQVAVDQTSEARRDFQLQDYLQEIITSLRPKFKRSPVKVVVECESDLLMDSYPGALSQVVTNLLVNALMHAYSEGQAGEIRIEAHRCEPNGIRLTVHDDGNGIPAENLPKIFQPFFTTKRGSGGSGLGLHIVYNIVRQRLGGSILVSSRPGEGTTFQIDMPSAAPAAAKEGVQ